MQKYTANRDNVGLDESWAAQVRDGSLNIAEVSDSSLKEKIQEYQKWNDMVNECSDSISDLRKEQNELTRDKIELVITKYEKLSTKASNANERIQNKIDLQEAQGGSVSAKSYTKMNKNLSKQIGYTKSQNSELKQLQKTVTKGSEAWYEYQEQIDKNNLINKKIDNIDNRQAAYDSAYNTSSKKLKSASSSISGMKKKSTKTKNAATNKETATTIRKHRNSRCFQ